MTTSTTNTTILPSTMNGAIGVNVWWTVREAMLPLEDAHVALAATGFEPEEEMPKPSRKLVVSRAVHTFQNRRTADGRKVTERTKENVDEVVYGILERERKDSEEVSYEQETTIRLDKKSGRVTAEGELSTAFFDVLSRQQECVTDADIRMFLRRIIKLTKGIALRPSGGIYFVPEQYLAILESAQQALDSMKCGARLYVQRIMDGAEERRIVAEAVEDDIMSQVEATMNAVERIEKRAGCMTSHEAKVSELQELMGIYQNLLGQEAKYEELAEALEEAATTVADKMANLQRDAEQRRQARKPAPKPNGSVITRQRIGKETVAALKAIVTESSVPMHVQEVAVLAEAQGIELRETNTKSKLDWVGLVIGKMAREGELERVGRGLYQGVAS
jgi:hypothetical protein